MNASIYYIAIIFLLLTEESIVAKTITSNTNYEKKKKEQTKRRLQNQIGAVYDNTVDSDTRQNIQSARSRTGRREQYATPSEEDVIVHVNPATETLTKRAKKKLANQLAREEHNTNARQTERRKRDNTEVTDVNDVPDLTTSSMQMNQRTQKLKSSTEAADLEFITPTASTANQDDNDEMVHYSSSNVLAVKGPRTNQNEKKTIRNKQVSTPIPTYFPTYSTYHPTLEMQEGGGGDTEQISRQNDNQMPTYYPTYSTYMPTPGDENTSNNMNTESQGSSGNNNSGGGGSSNNDSQQTYQPTGMFSGICAHNMFLTFTSNSPN